MKKLYVSLPFWILLTLSVASGLKGDYVTSGIASLILLVVGWLMLKVKKINNFSIDLDDTSLSVNQKEKDESDK